MPNQLLGVLLHTIAMSGLSRVRTELVQLLIVPLLAPHPVQANCQLACHSDLGGLASSPHRQMEIPAPPFRTTPHRDLGCFDRRPPTPRTLKQAKTTTLWR
jgi:hypothetical protein